MAPALTETNQEDNFKLPHSPNTSVINTSITQTICDRYTCNIPFDILQAKCSIFVDDVKKSDVDFDCHSNEKATNNLNANKHALFDRSAINSDLVCNYPIENGNKDCFMDRNWQDKSVNLVTHDICKLSKLMAEKLVNSDMNVHCTDHLYKDCMKSMGVCATNDLPLQINKEQTIDCSCSSKCDHVDYPWDVLNDKRVWTEANKRMERLQKNSARLLKRVRYLQMQKATTHVRNEIGAFVSYGHIRLGMHQNSHKRLKLSQKSTSNNRVASNAPSITTANDEKNPHYFKEKETLVPTNETKESIRFDLEDSVEIKRTVGTLRFNLNHLGLSVDSDVTDSSSGGESCEETEEISDKNQNSQVPIYRQATWRWSVDRAEISHRWIWLQAQIVDLEQRIRRLHSLYQKFRSAKKTPFQSPMQTDRSTQCECKKQTAADDEHISFVKSVNGFIAERTDDMNCKCNNLRTFNHEASRTRPFESFRKRKLYKLKDICISGTKAAKLSVKCSCKSQENMVSCILCTGQYKRTVGFDLDVMAISEKTAFLESCYHPVLSLQQDIPLSLHFQLLLKKCRISRQSPIRDRLQNKKQHIPQIRKQHRQAKKIAEIILPSTVSLKKQRDLSQSFTFSPSNSRPSSPNPYMFLNADGNSGISGRKRRGNAYDINNIVIPCCVVPAVRIEKLQYKEILTPKWRIVCQEDVNNHDDTKTEIVEDLSDEAFLTRHLKCEVKEKKWFMSYIRLRTCGRGRSRCLRFDVVPRSLHSFSSSGDLVSGCDDMSPSEHSPDVLPAFRSKDMLLENETRDSILCEKCSDITEQDECELIKIIEEKPYDSRTFPLTDEQYQEMLMEVTKPQQTKQVFVTEDFPNSSAISPEET